MILTLEIIGSQGDKPGTVRRKVFNATGGSIGRSPDNYWALPDPYISSRHALIRYTNGVFYLEDTESTNGVFVNSPDNQLVKGQPYAIKPGDLILIEPYEIRASISEPKEAAPQVSPSYAIPDDPFALTSPGLSAPVHAAGPDLNEDFGTSEENVDPLAWLGRDRQAPQDVPKASHLARKPVVSEHYSPPRPNIVEPPPPPPARQDAPLIPDSYDPLAPDDRPSAAVPPPRPIGDSRPPISRPRPVMPREAPEPAAPVAPLKRAPERAAPSVDGGDSKSVLAGAGLANAAVTPELARDFGEILRVVVTGVMDVLRARQDLKSEFRLGMTTFKPADNNPLKFSANAEDALHKLLVQRNPAYLGPVEAFEDAFDDVRHHQLAMLAGMRVAFDAMLAEFDPDRLQAEFERRLKKGALISAPAKLRYWDQYRQKIHDMVGDADTTFRELFGEEFARAYEEQLKLLKTRDRVSKRQGRE